MCTEEFLLEGLATFAHSTNHMTTWYPSLSEALWQQLVFFKICSTSIHFPFFKYG